MKEVSYHDWYDWSDSLGKLNIVEPAELIDISKDLLQTFKGGIEKERISKDLNSIFEAIYLKKEILYQKEWKNYLDMVEANDNDLKEIEDNIEILKSILKEDIKDNDFFSKEEIDLLSYNINYLDWLIQQAKILKTFNINYSKIKVIFHKKQVLSRYKWRTDINMWNVTKKDLLELKNNFKILKSKFEEDIKDNNIFDLNIRKVIWTEVYMMESIIRILSMDSLYE